MKGTPPPPTTPHPATEDESTCDATMRKLPKWIIWVLIITIGFPVVLMFGLMAIAEAITGPQSIYRQETTIGVAGGHIFKAEAGKTYFLVMGNRYAPVYALTDVAVLLQPVDQDCNPTDIAIRIEPGEDVDPRRRWGVSGVRYLSLTLADEVSGSHEVVIRNRRAFQ